MKKLFICILAIISFASMLTLTACKKDSNNDNSTPTTITISEADLSAWLSGMQTARTTQDNYTCTVVDEKTYIESDNSKSTYISNNEEARSGNKYYLISKKYSQDDTQPKNLISEQTFAIKTVNDNGTTRTKRYLAEKYYNRPEADDIKGYYVAPDTAKDLTLYSPSTMIEDLNLPTEASYEKILNMFKEWWFEDEDESNFTSKLSLEKDEDNSICLTFSVNYSYTQMDYDDNQYTNSGTESHKYLIKNGMLTHYLYSDLSVYDYLAQPNYNYTEDSSITFTFTYNNFNEDFYNSIDVSTETTENLYTGYVNFYYNGYEYGVDMKVPVGDSFNAEDVKNFLVGWDKNCGYNTLIGRLNYDDPAYDDYSEEQKAEWIEESKAENLRFMNAMQLYIDPEMTKPFTSDITINEYKENINIYIKLTAPEDTAWVISVIPSRNDATLNQLYVRFIQAGISNADNTVSFNANSRLSGFPVISVDGNEPSADGKYIFEKGSVHIFICENRY